MTTGSDRHQDGAEIEKRSERGGALVSTPFAYPILNNCHDEVEHVDARLRIDWGGDESGRVPIQCKVAVETDDGDLEAGTRILLSPDQAEEFAMSMLDAAREAGSE